MNSVIVCLHDVLTTAIHSLVCLQPALPLLCPYSCTWAVAEFKKSTQLTELFKGRNSGHSKHSSCKKMQLFNSQWCIHVHHNWHYPQLVYKLSVTERLKFSHTLLTKTYSILKVTTLKQSLKGSTHDILGDFVWLQDAQNMFCHSEEGPNNIVAHSNGHHQVLCLSAEHHVCQ